LTERGADPYPSGRECRARSTTCSVATPAWPGRRRENVVADIHPRAGKKSRTETPPRPDARRRPALQRFLQSAVLLRRLEQKEINFRDPNAISLPERIFQVHKYPSKSSVQEPPHRIRLHLHVTVARSAMPVVPVKSTPSAEGGKRRGVVGRSIARQMLCTRPVPCALPADGLDSRPEPSSLSIPPSRRSRQQTTSP
jgi:hypothetical protein